ncbi:MAG TPA: hypothetical protein VER79_03030 [Candidatus Limnocylindrales bacterium]|nr:hypothetical protein [Candidatus Limnocylindrales bacterium]
MNTQIRFTPVEQQETRLHMQEQMRAAEMARLAAPERAPRRNFVRPLWHAATRAGHGLWTVADEALLELADVLHGQRPHRHHHAH